MVRGTTVQFIYTLDFDVSAVKDARITVSQNNKPIIDKELCNCKMEGMQIVADLTQEETLKLSVGKAEVQLKVLFHDAKVAATAIDYIDVKPILNKEVLS